MALLKVICWALIFIIKMSRHIPFDKKKLVYLRINIILGFISKYSPIVSVLHAKQHGTLQLWFIFNFLNVCTLSISLKAFFPSAESYWGEKVLRWLKVLKK